jgi:hypothetical protein
MHELDGLYRHDGATTTWDGQGLTISRDGWDRQVPWCHVLGVRRIGSKPGFVQLMVRGHVPRSRLVEDEWSIRVSSEPDANRLLTDLGWRATGRGMDVSDVL